MKNRLFNIYSFIFIYLFNNWKNKILNSQSVKLIRNFTNNLGYRISYMLLLNNLHTWEGSIAKFWIYGIIWSLIKFDAICSQISGVLIRAIDFTSCSESLSNPSNVSRMSFLI